MEEVLFILFFTAPLAVSSNDGVALWREVLLHFRQSRKERSMTR